jgi:hypothetical protein
MRLVIDHPAKFCQRRPAALRHRRVGTTLVEVLVAIFVMGIGALAILAMFPLGAMNMARSIKDDRCGHAGANARAIAIGHNINFDTNIEVLNATTQKVCFNNPTGVLGGALFEDAPEDGQSYPLYIDPIGFASYPTTASLNGRDWMAGQTPGFSPDVLMRRLNLSFTSPTAKAATATAPFVPPTTLLWCTLLDDIAFDPNGTPSAAGGSVERAGKYSWAWLLRRPKTGVKSCCEMTIVVYEQRSLSTGVRGAVKESYFTTAWSAARPNVITLTIPGGKAPPQVREGGWILDATPVLKPGTKLFTSQGHAKFYRVVSVGDLGVGNTIEIELDKSVQNSADFAANTPRFVVLDGVVEVFECGTTWKSANN